jgi:hypothetical protein
VIRTRVTGAAQLRYVARLVERQRVAGLKKELSRAHREAFAPLLPGIKAEAATLPRSGGYAAIMARAVRVSARRTGLTTYAVVFARGRKEERDVRRVNAGQLRHPLFGNRDHWGVTSVRPGFVDRPVDELGEDIATRSLEALERVRDAIIRG